MKLKEYIEKQNNASYFSGLLERYYLAQEFIYSFNDGYREKNGKNIVATVPFFNLDNIKIQEVQPDEDTLAKRYKVIFPDVKSILPKNETFANVCYADYRTLRCKPMLGKAHDSSNGEVSAFYKNKEEYVVSTLSLILFYIYFGYHPLCGRDFYECASTSSDAERRFFQKKHDFIFKLEENSNRFVNGYHNSAWLLWNTLSEVQKSFWNEVWVGTIKTYDDFYTRWEKSYSGFTEALVPTPCDAKLNTIVFDEKYALVTSDNAIGNRTIRCRGCNNDLLSKCENCQIAVASRNATLLTIKVKFFTKQGNEGNSCEAETEVELYSGKTLYTTSTSIQSDFKRAVFEVVASKKNNLLGLRYLLDIPLEADCGAVRRFYKKDETIALLPGTHIYVLHVMRDVQKIVVPGVPIETAIPKTRGNSPVPSTQDPANKVSLTTDSPMVSYNVSTQSMPLTLATKEVIQTTVVSTVPTSHQTFVHSVKQPVVDDTNLIYIEDGNICDVLLNKGVEERQGCKLYTVKGRRQQQIYSLKLFDVPTDAQSKKRQDEIISNIRNILSQKKNLPLSLLYPKGIVSAKGFANNRMGYIYKGLPPSEKAVSSIINEPLRQGSDPREIAALLDLFNTIRSLHSMNLFYNRWELKNVRMDVENEKCYLVDNDYISIGAQGLTTYFLHLAAPELFNGFPIDELTDCYSLAVIAFMVIYKVHPYGKTTWKDRPAYDENMVRDECINNPHFIMDSYSTSLFSPRLSRSAGLFSSVGDKWENTPFYIQDLFTKTFAQSYSTAFAVKDREYYASIRRRRPTVNMWCEGLRKWYKDPKAQER